MLFANLNITVNPAYTAHILSLILLTSVAISNRWQHNVKRKVNKYVQGMFVVILSSVIADLAFYAFYLKPGKLATLMLYITNSWLYITELVVTYLLLLFLVVYKKGYSKKVSFYLALGVCFGTALMVMNCIKPFVFRVTEDNDIQRLNGFSWFTLISVVYFVISIVYYIIAHRKEREFKFISFWGVTVPVSFAFLFMIVFQSTSLEWCCIAIALSCILASLQQETLYIDVLTGVFNRLYLEHLHKKLTFTDKKMRAFMIDVNDFKKINDIYGHTKGDEALKDTAKILKCAIAENGEVCRYAGDEFVILIDSDDDVTEAKVYENIQQNLKIYNERKDKFFAENLSFAIGNSVFHPKEQTFDQFLQMIDKRMYEDKVRCRG